MFTMEGNLMLQKIPKHLRFARSRIESTLAAGVLLGDSRSDQSVFGNGNEGTVLGLMTANNSGS